MSTGQVTVPGPPIVLRRNEPVEITLVNHLTEATAIHWHGPQLDSYYDGVHGWSGIGQRLAPMIASGESFVVRFTPPRAGTFIYHTHLHDFRQLSSGLYGPLIVTEPGEAFDEAVDHVIVILLHRVRHLRGTGSAGSDPASVILNGERVLRFAWKAGQRHRIRLINITPMIFHSGAADVRWPGDVEAADQGRSPRAGGRGRARSRPPDDCRRRNVRFRIRAASGTQDRMALRTNDQRQVARSGPDHH